MEIDSSWLEEEPLQAICNKIRNSLAFSAKVRCEQDDGDESTIPKLGLECGHAKFYGEKRVWNVRHRAINPASTETLGSTRRKSRKSRTSFDSLGFSGKSSPSTPSTPMHYCQYARLVAKLSEKNTRRKNEECGQNEDSCSSQPPLGLVQCILKGAEFSSMLKQASSEISETPSMPLRCWTRLDKQPIDLKPILNYIRKHHMPSEPYKAALESLLDGAIQFSIHSSGDLPTNWAETWDLEFCDDVKGFSLENNMEPAFQAIHSFARKCLEQPLDYTDSTPNEKQIRSKRSRQGSDFSETTLSAYKHARSPEGKQLSDSYCHEIKSRESPRRNLRKTHFTGRGDLQAETRMPTNLTSPQHQIPGEDLAPSISTDTAATTVDKRRTSRHQHPGQASTPVQLVRSPRVTTGLLQETDKIQARTTRRCWPGVTNISADANMKEPNDGQNHPEFHPELSFPGPMDTRKRESDQDGKACSLFGMFAGSMNNGVPRAIFSLQHPDSSFKTYEAGNSPISLRYDNDREEDHECSPEEALAIYENKIFASKDFYPNQKNQHSARRAPTKALKEKSTACCVEYNSTSRNNDIRAMDTVRNKTAFQLDAETCIDGVEGKGNDPISKAGNILAEKNDTQQKKVLAFSEPDNLLSPANVDVSDPIDTALSNKGITHNDAQDLDEKLKTSATVAPCLSEERESRKKISTKPHSPALRRSPRKNFRCVDGNSNLSSDRHETRKRPPKSKTSLVSDDSLRSLSSDENPCHQKKRARPNDIDAKSKQSESAEGAVAWVDDAGRVDDSSYSVLKPTQAPVIPWVKLIHTGHISDYHGLQRKYESAFIPLMFNTSLCGTQEAIDETLKKMKFGEGDDSDEEVACETKNYRKIIAGYALKAKHERAERKARAKKLSSQKQDSQETEEAEKMSRNTEYNDFVTRPFRFVVNDRGGTEVCNAGTECLLCGKREEHTATSSLLLNNHRINPIDSENIEFWQEENNKNARRKSRTAEVKSQKAISLMMLSELRHTLTFIQEYNKGKKKDEEAIPQEEEHLLGSAKATGPTIQTSTKISLRSGATTQNQKTLKSESKSQPLKPMATRSEKFPSSSSLTIIDELPNSNIEDSKDATIPEKQTLLQPSWVKLTHIGLLSDYEGVQRKYPSFYPLPTQGTTESLKESIKTIVDGDGGDCSSDEEAKLERKAHFRIAKMYQQKADQERIEKREHEEDRILKVREYEYLNRTKKTSPEEIEYKQLDWQSFQFVAYNEENKADRWRCKFGENCSLCGPFNEKYDSVAISENKFQSTAVYHPRFRKVDLDDVVEDDVVDNESENAVNRRRRNRTAELHSQRKASAKKLNEMYHTLDFIEKYNSGLIFTPGKRKSRK